jgi:hypothetical protein
MIRKAFNELFSNNSRSIATLSSLITAIFVAGALASYNPSDASFNRATSEDNQNIFGFAGSYIADPLLQFFGISAF